MARHVATSNGMHAFQAVPVTYTKSGRHTWVQTDVGTWEGENRTGGGVLEKRLSSLAPWVWLFFAGV